MESTISLQAKEQFRNGVLSIVGSFLLHLFLGSVYLWGNINVYITSYLHSVNSDITLDNTNIVFALQSITAAVSMPIGPFLARLTSIRFCIILGSLLNIASVFVSSFLQEGTSFVIVYACGAGLGMG